MPMPIKLRKSYSAEGVRLLRLEAAIRLDDRWGERWKKDALVMVSTLTKHLLTVQEKTPFSLQARKEP